MKDAGDKFWVKFNDENVDSTHEIVSDNPIFLVVDFNSDAEETGFSLSFVKTRFVPEPEIILPEIKEYKFSKSTIGIISLFFLMMIFAIISAVVT